MNTLRRGCKRPLVPPHHVRMSFRMHSSAAANVPPSFDLRETGLVAEVKDQGETSSCEGHSSSGATETAFALAGLPLGFIPSEAGLYAGGRSVERSRSTSRLLPLPALQDEGANTEDVVAFMATFGIRPRHIAGTSDGRNSDCELATINDEPKLADFEEGAPRLIVGPYAIDPQASDTEHLIQAAIASLVPVRVDAFVDRVFEDWTPSRAPIPAPNQLDPEGGGHAIYFVAYTPTYYVIRNSWSTSYGDAGDFHVSREWVREAWGIQPWICRLSA